jgi:hypothetical protein
MVAGFCLQSEYGSMDLALQGTSQGELSTEQLLQREPEKS